MTAPALRRGWVLIAFAWAGLLAGVHPLVAVMVLAAVVNVFVDAGRRR